MRCWQQPRPWLSQYEADHHELLRREAEHEEAEQHDPDECGCTYRGNNMWSCGHIDQP